MDAERYRRLRELLEEASVLDERARRALVEKEREADEDLARQLESLLRAESIATGDLFGSPADTKTTVGEPGRRRPWSAAPESLGPYRLGPELGRGGMGVVHAAEDTRDGRGVALKVVHDGLLTTGRSLERFLREAEAGSRVRHENVVRTLEAGSAEADGRRLHFLVMERVDGRSLRRLLDQLGRVPEGLLREIALQAAQGLAAIHAAGIVHRDIKPENLLLTEDQRLRISDLGVAKILEASASLTRDGQFLGTLQYAAPEQLEGGDVGPAADLYSLGVVLHELATGENPFSRDNPVAILKAQMEVVPRPVDDPNPDISPFVAEVIATLVAKRPAERIGSADELSELLRAGEASPWWGRREHERRTRSRRLPRVPVRRMTRMFGREAELAAVSEAWDAARAGRGGTVLLVGEAGLGKTRLLDEVLRSASVDDAHVLYGSHSPAGEEGALEQALVGKFGRAALGTEVTRYLGDAPALVDTLVTSAGAGREPAAEGAGVEALRVAAGRLLAGLADERPVLWVLEDLHFAPEAGWQLAGALGRAAGRRRALVVLTSRPASAESRSRLAIPSLREIALARLRSADVAAMLDELLEDSSVATELTERIAPRSDGVPFFVLEMLRGLEERGTLRRGPEGVLRKVDDLGSIALPAAVRDLVVGRLEGLGRRQRELLDVAALQGHEFESDALAAVLDRRKIQVLQDLAEIERVHGLVRPAGLQFRFDHHLIQEILHAEMPEALRREYHALLGETFEARLGAVTAREHGDVVRLAVRHHLRGSRASRALPHLDEALTGLSSRWLNDEMLDLLDRAMSLGAEVEEAQRVDLLLRRAETLNVLGRRDEERAAAETAVALADGLGDVERRIRARCVLGTLLWQVAEERDAVEILTDARELARAAGATGLELQAANRLGIALARLERHEEARETADWCRSTAERLGDVPALARAEGNHGNALCWLSRFEEGLPHLIRARELAAGLSDRRLQATAEAGLGLGYWHLGEFERAEDHHRRHVELSVELGDVRGEAIGLGNLAMIALERGHFAECLRGHEAECRIYEVVGDRRHLPLARANSALAYIMLGAHDEARRRLATSRADAEALGARRTIAHVTMREAYLAEAGGRLEETEGLAREAAAGFLDVSDTESAAQALTLAGCAAFSRSRPEDARALFDEALERSAGLQAPRSRVLAAIGRACLPDGDAAAATRLLDEVADRMGHLARVEARLWAWRATEDRRHVEEAWRLVEASIPHAPPEYRESMLTAAPLHRDVRDAWRALENRQDAT